MEEVKVVNEVGGVKNDGAKLRLELIEPLWLKEMAEILAKELGLNEDMYEDLAYTMVSPVWLKEMGIILTKGAKKYASDNWKKVEDSRLTGSLFRHIMGFLEGNELDDEGNPHLMAVMLNAGFLRYKQVNDDTKKSRVMVDRIAGPFECKTKNSLLFHYQRFRDGYEFDEVTGYPHLAVIMVNAGLLRLEQLENK